MATQVTIPALGESISEAVIAAWLKKSGEYVERDEELVELETDKVTMPLPSPAAGVFTASVEEGDTVEVGASIGTIDESAAKPEGSSAPAASKEPKAAPADAPAPKAASAPAAASSTPAASSGGATGGDVHATALAKKIATERGIDLTKVTPSGASGRVREQDVLAFDSAAHMSNGAPQSASASGHAGSGSFSRGVRQERMSQLRKSIAGKLVEAQHNAAMLTTFNECDMTNVMALRSRLKDQFADTHGTKLGFMSFFTKACVSALKKYPAVNAYIVQGEKGLAFEYHDYADIAFAVGTDKGLVVPVLRNCESLSFSGIESGLVDLAKKARDGKLSLEDMQGGTFTISNGGVYGSMMSTPILNAPQSGILGMHNIIKRPVENPDKPGEIALRPMMYLALSYDHRVVDGEGAVGFLKHVKECIEDPNRMMLEV